MPDHIELWNNFIDARLISLSGVVPGDIMLVVQAPILRANWPDGGSLFILRLRSCVRLEWILWQDGEDEGAVGDFMAVARLISQTQPELLLTQSGEMGRIVIYTQHNQDGIAYSGKLILRYESSKIFLENGIELPVEEIIERGQQLGGA